MIQKQYQSKYVQASDRYMDEVEHEITHAIIDGTIEIAADSGDAQ